MNEVLMKLINSGLAGVLVMLGGCAGGSMSWDVVYFSFIAGSIVAISQFKDYFSKIKPDNRAKTRLFDMV